MGARHSVGEIIGTAIYAAALLVVTYFAAWAWVGFQ